MSHYAEGNTCDVFADMCSINYGSVELTMASFLLVKSSTGIRPYARKGAKNVFADSGSSPLFSPHGLDHWLSV